jgi:uncharacterized membrane protein YcaP (DUF421 family)
MEKADIKLDDIQRILFGEAPVDYLLEVLIRTLILFIALLIFLRLIGKRMGGVITISELAVMLTLGAILAVPMQIPDRGIFQGIIIMVTILVLQRGLNLWEFKSNKLERLTQGSTIMLVKDGIIESENLTSTRISKQQLFAELRKKKIYNLGKVKRMYVEACGIFSIYEHDKPVPGLSVVPPSDEKMYKFKQPQDSDLMACSNCGNTVPQREASIPCKICKNNDWIKAVT